MGVVVMDTWQRIMGKGLLLMHYRSVGGRKQIGYIENWTEFDRKSVFFRFLRFMAAGRPGMGAK